MLLIASWLVADGVPGVVDMPGVIPGIMPGAA